MLIDTLTIGTYASGFLISRLEGFDFPEIDIDIVSRGSWHGARLGRYKYDRRIMSIEIEIWGSNASDFETKRRQLELALRLTGGLKTVKFTTRQGLNLQFDAILNSKFSAPYKKGAVITCIARVEFVAPYPFLVAQSAQTPELPIFEGGGFAIPFDIPLDMSNTESETSIFVTNNGNAIAFPTIRIYGIIENPSIINNTTGEGISITYTLEGVDDYIDIDLYNRTAVLNGATNIKQHVTGDWFALMAGSNELRLTASSSGTGARAVVTFRDSYLGI